jgi:flagellar biosynthesis GTPase FlhF
MQFAHLCFYQKLDLKEALENLSNLDHVFLDGAGKDKDAIEVDKDEPVHHVA